MMNSNIFSRFAQLLFAFVLLSALFSCAPHSVSNKDTPIEVERPIPGLRIISLVPSQTEIVYALGLKDYLVGWTMYCNYPPEVQETPGWVRYDKYEYMGIEHELSKPVAVVSEFLDVNMSLIDSLNPTLILSVHGLVRDDAEDLTERGFNVLHYEPATLEDVWSMIEDIGRATGKGIKARQLTSQYRKEVEEIRQRALNLPKQKVYFEINHDGPYALGSGSPIHEMIEIAGGINIFEDIEEYGDYVDFEDIAERNPGVILTPLWPAAGEDEVTTIREVLTREGFENINAVINSRVIHYDSALFKSTGPRQVTALKKMARLLHPYYFQDPENSVDPWELGKIDVSGERPKVVR